MVTLAVALAAGVGAVVRYTMDRVVTRRLASQFPGGTFAVNVSGSLLLGVLVGLVAHHHMDARILAIAGAGFAGGYTTLSTWAWESLALAEIGEMGQALLNVVASVLVGLLAAAAGLGLARL